MYNWLTGARRVAEAIADTPDCVPIYGSLPTHALHLAGIPARTFYSEPAPFVQAQVLLAEYYGFDLPIVFGDMHNIEAEALGRRVLYHEGAAPLLDPAQRLVQNRADLECLQAPDFERAGRMPFLLEGYRLAGEMTGLPALRWFCAPFSLACAVRGYTALVRDIRQDPSFAHALLERLTEQILIPWIRVQLAQPPPARAATGVDPWASVPIVTWPIIQEFVRPYVLRLRDLFAAEGYSVGAVGQWGESRLPDPVPFLEAKIEMRGSLRGLDPDVQRLGPGLYVETAARHGVALALGLDSRLIHDGPVAAIAARVRAYIAAAAPRGRFTLVINNVPGDTPPEHIQAAVAAARLYGQYPLAPDLESIPFEMPDVEPFADFCRRRGWRWS
ncbi:MAG: uroporphyrinogen decarboxylase family protein [Anaerolineae bacterium]|jgi:uroporphyrinogen-III decarboxylase|nr:uroporphyrinogen decarboxylase family protein [Anaerolineae bacterium]